MKLEDIKPFGLTPASLKEVKILFGFYSGKTGAGKQEIQINGDGTVRLFFSKTMEDKTPSTLEGSLSLPILWHLLDFMDGNDFFGLQDHYAAHHEHQHAHARRLLGLTLPGREKTIMIDEPELYVVEQLVGAVRLAAGIALPEAINHRFFPNLS